MSSRNIATSASVLKPFKSPKSRRRSLSYSSLCPILSSSPCVFFWVCLTFLLLLACLGSVLLTQPRTATLPVPLPYLSLSTRSLGAHPCSWLAGVVLDVVFWVLVVQGRCWLFFPWKTEQGWRQNTGLFLSPHTDPRPCMQWGGTEFDKKCFEQQNSRIVHSTFNVQRC